MSESTPHAETQSAQREKVNLHQQVFVDGEAIEHQMMDAIIMSASALTMMAGVRYRIWSNYVTLRGFAVREPEKHQPPIDAECYQKWVERESQTLRELCVLIDAAMQFIGDANNNTDAVDEYGLTNHAFEAMNRALQRHIEPTRIKACPVVLPAPSASQREPGSEASA